MSLGLGGGRQQRAAEGMCAVVWAFCAATALVEGRGNFRDPSLFFFPARAGVSGGTMPIAFLGRPGVRCRSRAYFLLLGGFCGCRRRLWGVGGNKGTVWGGGRRRGRGSTTNRMVLGCVVECSASDEVFIQYSRASSSGLRFARRPTPPALSPSI
ncbi:hypothetical protein B0H16DRAFT_1566654 [Mycena metata]|uniref:Uncharacterized protein n=1 Tax=Mycena metata TaxID=1033252 RepID=A0AAD7N1Z5_9AGAR|nr:hypothetical protein B0H16DRAFT_1566654 [Mycena metata]